MIIGFVHSRELEKAVHVIYLMAVVFLPPQLPHICKLSDSETVLWLKLRRDKLHHERFNCSDIKQNSQRNAMVFHHR